MYGIKSLYDNKLETEENCRRVIQTIESVGRCILFIDEIEKALNNHAVSGISDSGTSSRFFATFLTWMSEHTTPCFIIATSNNYTILPPELIRKGRFDEIFWLDIPDLEERVNIWEVIIKRFGRDPKKFNIKQLAAKSVDFTGSEIENTFKDAMFYAFDAKKEVTDDYIFDQIINLIPQAKTNAVQLEKMRDQAKDKLRIARETPERAKEVADRKIDVTFDKFK